jgi:DNA-binding NarL/FixJ family response regulator
MMPVLRMEPIRIVLANHHPIIRSNLRLLLEREPSFRVIGEAADGREALTLAEYRRPEVVLLDVQLPPVSGISTAREIAAKRHGFGIVFVAVLTDDEYVSEAIRAGARGYVLEDAASTDLVQAIQIVAHGGRFLSPAISRKLMDNDRAISEHEKQLCCLLAAGYGEHEIARQLNSTPGRIRADSQNAGDRIPAVILDSIRANHHLVESELFPLDTP